MKAKCICQICTCGRHRCPHRKNDQSGRFEHSNGAPFTHQSSEYHQAYEGKSVTERSEAVRPKEEFVSGGGGIELHESMSREQFRRYNESECLAAKQGVVKRADEWIVDKPPLKRPQTSGRAIHRDSTFSSRAKSAALTRSKSADMRIANLPLEEEEQSGERSRITKQRYITSAGARRNRASNVRLGSTESPTSLRQSSYAREYQGQLGERADVRARALRTSESVVAQSRANSDRRGRAAGEEGDIGRPSLAKGGRVRRRWDEEAADMGESGAVAIAATTQHTDEHAEAAARREAQRRSSALQGKGPMAQTTASREEFAAKAAERVVGKRPADHGKLVGVDSSVFESRTENNERYVYVAKGDRYPTRKPEDSNVLKGAGRLDTETEQKRQFRGAGIAERAVAVRPKSAGVFERDERHSASQWRTSNSDEFQATVGERYETRRRPSDDIWKTDQPFETSTISKEAFVATRGERYEMKRPKDSDILKSDAPFNDETAHRDAFKGATRAKTAVVRRSSDSLWKREGRMDEATAYSEAFKTSGKGERYETRRPEDHGIIEKDGQLEERTNYRESFTGAGRGERYDTVRRGSDEMWKSNGKMQQTTVNGETYRQTAAGERAETRKPRESNALKATGRFNDQTEHNEMYRADVIDERVERQHQSSLQTRDTVGRRRRREEDGSGGRHWAKLEDTPAEGDYRRFEASRVRTLQQEDEHIAALPPATASGERTAQKAATAAAGASLRGEGAMELHTAYEREYSLAAADDHCYAGLLVDSVRDNYRPTSRFDYSHDAAGHKFFEPKPLVAA